LLDIDHIIKKNLKAYINEVDISKSHTAINNVCSTKKICDEQGKITFGQLRELVESGKIKRIATHVGEGGYKALLRLVPWFLPQLVLLGFGATWIRVINKLFRPTLEETTNYRTWWGKTILKVFDLVEGELNAGDPLSKIFFISDGLMTMLNDKYKVEFARYITDVADEKSEDEIVPDYFVENELRHWLNEKFFLDPPLQPKNAKIYDVSDLPFEKKIEEDYKIRTFTQNIVSEELKWHFDSTDREVTIIESKGWKFQMDNELPKILKEGQKLFIPKGIYHRVIKGDGKLKIKIKEF